MKPQHNFILAILSQLNDDRVNRLTQKRYDLLYGPKKSKKAWLPWVATAACLAIVVGVVLAILPMINNPSIPSDKQVPIYQGMTISNTPPEVVEDTLSVSPPSLMLSVSEAVGGMLQSLGNGNNKDNHKPHENGMDSAIKNHFPAISPESTQYFAKKNEDIYIHIHISNPDKYEILSFTLNDKKYSSYMFEDGSDLETLILKYNVGDVEGPQSYTIDAIKYVDGDQIKDVRMEGDKTVQVNIYPEDQPMAQITNVLCGNTTLSFTPTVVDNLGLMADSDGELYAILFNGEEIISTQPIVSGQSVTFDSLTPATPYQYAIVGIYDAIDGLGKAPHILYQDTAQTSISIAFENVELKGLSATFDITGGERIISLGLYQGEVLYRELALDCRQVDHLPFDIEVSLVATYEIGDTTHSISYPLPVIKESEGLSIVNGVIRGFGNCYDTTLYLNHPIAPGAFTIVFFPPEHIVTEVYCGEGVTSIGDNAFRNHQFLSKIVLPANLSEINADVFAECSQLLHIFIPQSVTRIGLNALRDIDFIYYEGSEEAWADIEFEPNDEHSNLIFFDQDFSSLSIKAPPSGMNYMITIDDFNPQEGGYQIRGWVSFEKPIDTFGYYIQDESNAIYDEAFTIIGADHNDIISVGGKHARRFEINIDFSTYSTGQYPMGILVKFQDGSVVTLFEVPVTWG